MTDLTLNFSPYLGSTFASLSFLSFFHENDIKTERSLYIGLINWSTRYTHVEKGISCEGHCHEPRKFGLNLSQRLNMKRFPQSQRGRDYLLNYARRLADSRALTSRRDRPPSETLRQRAATRSQLIHPITAPGTSDEPAASSQQARTTADITPSARQLCAQTHLQTLT